MQKTGIILFSKIVQIWMETSVTRLWPKFCSEYIYRGKKIVTLFLLWLGIVRSPLQQSICIIPSRGRFCVKIFAELGESSADIFTSACGILSGLADYQVTQRPLGTRANAP